MELEFKRILTTPGWKIENDKIITNGKTLLIKEISSVGKGVGLGWYYITFLYQNKKSYTLYCPKKDVLNWEKAYNYILENASDAETTKLRNEVLNKEHRMKCNVCGNIFCYTLKDVQKNINLVNNAKWEAISGLGNAIAGTQYGALTHSANAERKLDKVVDYTKCPKCNSSDIIELEDNENTTNTQNIDLPNEIRKYKQLLEDGIITEEEFENKKKQILNM